MKRGAAGLIAAISAVVLANVASAQVPPAAGAAEISTAAIGSFSHLPTEERVTARALFMAQQPTASGPAPLNLDQIASLGVARGWKNIFMEMRKRGLLRAKSLDQAVNAYRRQMKDCGTAAREDARIEIPVVIATGTGRMLAAPATGAGIANGPCQDAGGGPVKSVAAALAGGGPDAFAASGSPR